MGLLLLIPGLVFLLNGTTWFSGENAVGRVLIIIGVVLTVLQLIFAALVKSRFDKEVDRMRRW